MILNFEGKVVAASERCPLVSIVVLVRNEGRVLAQCLRSLIEQKYPSDRVEILVIDGRSSDGSREIAHELMASAPNLRLLDNPSTTTPAGMNVGIREAAGSIIVIAGAHAVYSPAFVQNCVAWLEETGADVVGGPVKTESLSAALSAQVACAILSSKFGVGNSRFRTGGRSGFVDTVPFGAYRREVFERVGLFNERLVRNQDNELSARVRRAGGKIYFTPDLAAAYFTTDSYVALLRQTLQKTQWHIRTLCENRRAFGYRHMVPAIFFVVLVSLGVFAWSHTYERAALLAILALYLTVGLFLSIRSLKGRSLFLRIIVPFACFPFHMAYAIGTLLGLRHLSLTAKAKSPSGVPGHNRIET